MKQTRILMGMPVTLEVVDPVVNEEIFSAVFAYFESIDEKFSTYKEHSEISRINRGEIPLDGVSKDMHTIFKLAEKLRLNTDGYFDIRRDGQIDPSGLVKGWAIFNAAEMVRQNGYKHFYVEAGGDFEVMGKNSAGQKWQVGIQSPFNHQEIIKVLSISNRGVATSGTYVRGQHIYNPKASSLPITEIVGITVIGPNIFTADCFATAAFAMGKKGIHFIENLKGYEAYMVDIDQRATFTSGFKRYISHA